MDLVELTDALGLPCPSNMPLTGVVIDSRQVQSGNLFVAIRGERFDGHAFLAEAESRGAAAVLCQQADSGVTIPQIEVPDTMAALTRWATSHRQRMSCKVVALTGSNGKTTTKEMIAAILPQPAHATRGNLNNHLGVPLSVLQLKPEHRYGVFELGANHLGEIAKTVAIVRPDVTLINNIAPAHIEGFGSIDGVARAKGEIHQGLALNGTAIINADDAYAHFWDDFLVGKRVIRFSREEPAEVTARGLTFDKQGCGAFTLVTPSGESPIALLVPGVHNVSNALAAAACSVAMGIELPAIVTGLNEFTGVAGRMTFRRGRNQARIIDDTYNANLRSVLSALDVLAKYAGKRVFVFGDMGELGEWTKAHHEEVGKVAAELGIDLLLTCGAHSQYTTEAFGLSGSHFPSQTALVEALLPQLDPETTVLVKGSRSSAMEKVVEQVLDL